MQQRYVRSRCVHPEQGEWYMNVGAVSFQPYLYNVNRISASSMGKVQPLTNDTEKSRIDFSSLTGENENPLRMGESKNFMDILSSQMQMSRSNAARILQTTEPIGSMDVFGSQKAQDMQSAPIQVPAEDMMNNVLDDLIVNAL